MRRHAMWLRSLGILAAIAATDCGLSGRGGTSAAQTPASPAGDLTATAPPSEAECRDYAQAVVKAVAASDLVALNKLVDWDIILQTSVLRLEMTDEFRSGLFAGMRKVHDDADRGLSGQLIKNSKNGGSFHFLRTRQNHGPRVVLFRMIQPGEKGGVNYFEFAPRRYPEGQIRSIDLYNYMSGEFMSETLRRTLLPMIAEQSRSIFDKLITGERDFVHDFPELGRASKLLAQGKPVEALAIHKKMRPETRKQKVVLLGRLRAAQGADDEKEYAEVIEEFHKLFPGDPCLDLISIDGYLMRKDLDGAMKAVDRLDESLGGDPYLDTLRAGFRELQGDRDGARRFALRAIEKEPSLIGAHWSLVAYSLEAKDYKETLARLKEIDRRFSVTFNDLRKQPVYAGFVQSPQYSEWLDYLKAKPPARKPAPTGKSLRKDPAAPAPVKKGPP